MGFRPGQPSTHNLNDLAVVIRTLDSSKRLEKEAASGGRSTTAEIYKLSCDRPSTQVKRCVDERNKDVLNVQNDSPRYTAESRWSNSHI